MAASKLTAKQAMFVKEYLIDLNATQAAIRAGYSEATANVIGCENLTKPYLQEAIQKAADKRAEKVDVTAEYVLKTIKDTTEKCVKENQPQNVFRGCELLGKHLKLFTDKVELDGVLGVKLITNVEDDDGD